jgi:carbon monoxide dehydrogenase subunit G
MKLSSSFSVPADCARVFELLLDAPTMRSCIPGCQELERTSDTHYQGRLVNEIAHVRFNASFAVDVTSVEPPHQIHAVLSGADRKLASALKLNGSLLVSPEGPGSALVTYTMELAIRGKLGRLGESIIRRRTAEAEREFVTAFARACAAGSAPTTYSKADRGLPSTEAPAMAEPAGPDGLQRESLPSAEPAGAPRRAAFWPALRRRLARLKGRGHR